MTWSNVGGEINKAGWKDGDPVYVVAKHSVKLLPVITQEADHMPLEPVEKKLERLLWCIKL